ncbi:MAG: hypothetical protein HY725_01845 [Candidatus Rokubacteria bacterium]|nr:hypothetical protein [Candidatus Rokubacteria bacterium]
MRNDLEELRAPYRETTIEELLRIIHIDSQNYRPDAVQVAREDLQSRDVSEATDPNVQGLLANLKEAAAFELDQADTPLGTGLKVLCFLLCGLPGMFIAVYQQNQGRKRRAREAWRWVGYG